VASRAALPPNRSEQDGAGAAQPPSAALCEQSSVSSASKGSSPNFPDREAGPSIGMVESKP